LRVLTECQHVVLRAHDEQELLDGICRLVVDAGFEMAWVGFAEHDAARTVRPVAHAGVELDYLRSIRVSYDDGEHGRGPTGIAIRTGEVQIARTLKTQPDYAPWRALALQRGFRSSAAFPLIAGGRPFGALNVYAAEEDAFDGDATTLLGALAIDLADAITARRVQHLVADSRDRLARILDRISTFVVLMAPDGSILEINASPLIVAGLRRDDVLGRQFADLPPFTHPVASHAQLVDALARARRGESVQFELVCHVGRVLVLDARIEPILDADGRVIELVGSGTDITSQRDARVALRASEERARALVDNALDLIAVIGADGVFQMLSPSVETIGGYREAELLGTSAFDLIHREDLAGAAARFIALGATPNGVDRMALRIRHANGSYRSLQAVARNLTHVPAVGGVLLNARDITEQLAAEARLRQNEWFDAIGQLAGGIAHDFNNVLTIIQSNAELIHESPVEEHAELVDEIRAAARRATDLTSRLLLLSRKESEVRKPVDLHVVLREVISLVSRAVDRRIALDANLHAEHPLVLGDPTHLHSAFLNLALNGRDAMPAGGRLSFTTRDVTLDAERARGWPDPLEPGDYIEVTVSDTGHGIPAAIRTQVFQPFFTTKPAGHGTGLGLAAVRSCARTHHGAVTLDSEVDHGTSVRVLLPRSTAQVDAPSLASRLVGQRARLLVIDDEDAVRRATTRALRSYGYEVDDDGDPDRALATLAADPRRYDLVVLDLNMPGRNGVDVHRAIRQLSPSPAVLFCSGHPPDAIPRELLEDGRTGYIAKPFRIGDMVIALTRALAP